MKRCFLSSFCSSITYIDFSFCYWKKPILLLNQWNPFFYQKSMFDSSKIFLKISIRESQSTSTRRLSLKSQNKICNVFHPGCDSRSSSFNDAFVHWLEWDDCMCASYWNACCCMWKIGVSNFRFTSNWMRYRAAACSKVFLFNNYFLWPLRAQRGGATDTELHQ